MLNKFKKIIDEKQFEDTKYQLCHLRKDGLFVIYKWVITLKDVHRIPKVFQSYDKEESEKYFKKLLSKYDQK